MPDGASGTPALPEPCYTRVSAAESDEASALDGVELDLSVGVAVAVAVVGLSL